MVELIYFVYPKLLNGHNYIHFKEEPGFSNGVMMDKIKLIIG